MSGTKVTLTLPEDLLAVVDDFVAHHPGATRGGVCAEALREWLRVTQEAEIARYYVSLSEKEHLETSDWGALAARSAERLWP